MRLLLTEMLILFILAIDSVSGMVHSGGISQRTPVPTPATITKTLTTQTTCQEVRNLYRTGECCTKAATDFYVCPVGKCWCVCTHVNGCRYTNGTIIPNECYHTESCHTSPDWTCE